MYYSISEVSKLTKLKAYVLRYWETEFSQLKPSKNRAGTVHIDRKILILFLKIKDLLYKEKYTIEGARIALSRKSHLNTSNSDLLHNKNLLNSLRNDLREILKIINK